MRTKPILDLRLWAACAAALLVATPLVRGAQVPVATARYFPPAGAWEKRTPSAVGMDATKVDAAVAFAIANENARTKDLAVDIPETFRNEAPYNNLIGPTQPRTGANGLIIRRGYVVAEWGDTARADMTFSVTKTFLSTVVGVAFDRGKIKDVHDRVGPYMPVGVDLFTAPHNSKITWDHLLRQTSDWSGTLWGKPDWADRPPRGQTPDQWPNREMREPGTFYKYNDVRVNVLSLATLYVMRQPLPEVLKQSVMDPIGASATWHWEPYENAYVTIDGKRMPSVPGGGHHGGGMFINAWDMARFGYLFLNNGAWRGQPLVSTKWIAMAKTPGTGTNAESSVYGYMNWFLNVPSRQPDGTPGRKMYPAAPSGAVAFRGNGENIIYIDWDHDLVVVVRWLGRGAADFFSQVVGSVIPAADHHH
jgi:CubicO group peptidase (beta-lactamase class C family)